MLDMTRWSYRVWRPSIRWDRRLNTDDILLIIHHNEAQVSNQNTNLNYSKHNSVNGCNLQLGSFKMRA